ncbi:MAG TPA: helix-turn-helix transcriptional regulator [Polyangium sp.]|nr:helix-turn-helix transcriptional regulator [Polyangium sp.]
MNTRDKHYPNNGCSDKRLTPAEHEISKLLVDTGYSLKEIAAHRGRSYDTVRTQVERIYKKLGVHSRPELVVKCRMPEPPSMT